MWNNSDLTELPLLEEKLAMKLDNYSKCPQLLHTIMHGPEGSGKYFAACAIIAKHFKVPLQSVFKRKRHVYIEKEREYWYQQSSFHFEIDVALYADNHQAVIIEIIMDLSKSKNVYNNKYQIIFLKNAEFLELSIQHQLRKMMESLYSTCRIFFFTHMISCIDPTIQSRCLLITFPLPSNAKVELFLQSRNQLNHNLQEVISAARGNLNYAWQHLKYVDYGLSTSCLNTTNSYAKNVLKLLLDHTKDTCAIATSLRQLFREIYVSMLPVDEIVSSIVFALLKSQSFQKAASILHFSVFVLYLRNLAYRKEFSIELLMSKLVLILNDCDKNETYHWV